MFRIGIKSPFCYTDTFNVISIQNGIKLIYTCFLENGVPKCAKLGHENTEEHSGMYIQFSVKENDIRQFIKHSEIIYNRFINRPKILNCEEFKYADRTSKFEGDDWKLIGNQYRCYAIMGNIAYPISSQNLKISTYNLNHNDEKSLVALLRCGIDISFGIGQLEIAANRESLHFDDRTIKNIKARLSSIVSELRTLVEQKIGDSKTFYDACDVYNEIFINGKYLNAEIARCLQYESFTFDGKSVGNLFNLNEIFKDNKARLPLKEYYWGKGNNWNSERKARSKKIYNFTLKKNNIWVINDLKTGGVSRITNYISNNQDINIIRLPEDIDDAQAVIDYLQLPSKYVKKTSEMDKPLSSKVKRMANIRKLRRLVSCRSYYTSSNTSNEEDVDITNGKVNLYVEMSRGEPTHGWYTSKLLNLAKDIGIKNNDTVIYTVNQSVINKIKEQNNWYELKSYCKSVIEKKLKSTDAGQLVANKEYSETQQHNFDKLNNLQDNISRHSVNCKELTELTTRINKFLKSVSDNAKTLDWYYNYVYFFNKELTQEKPSVNFDVEIKSIFNKFPLLEFIQIKSVETNAKSKAVADYIVEKM